jgi:hypothetical protein
LLRRSFEKVPKSAKKNSVASTSPARASALRAEGPSRGRKRMTELTVAGHEPSPIMQINHAPMTPERFDRFLEKVAQTGNLALASRLADGFHSARSYKRLIDSDPQAKLRYEDSLDAYSGTVAQVLNEEVIDGNIAPVVSAGSIVKDKHGKEIYLRRRDPKLVAMLARAHNDRLRDVKTVVNLSGEVVGSDQDPSATILSSDLWQLTANDSAELLRILKVIHLNRNADLALTNPKVINGDVEEVPETDESWLDAPDLIAPVLKGARS